MRILVFGNINAGKSHVVKILRELNPTLPVLSIDEYRQRSGGGTFEGDEAAMKAFVADASASESCIVECTGLGPLGRRLQTAMDSKTSIILHVRAELSTCLERINQKDFSATPYSVFEKDLPVTLSRCHAEFEEGDLEELWKPKAIWIFSVDGEAKDTDNRINKLPFDQIRALAAVYRALETSHFA